MVLDFDGIGSVEETIIFKNSISSNEYVFSCWISPSNLGVKALIKVPTEGDFKGYYDALKNYFNSPYWDKSGSDIYRPCFESYDPVTITVLR